MPVSSHLHVPVRVDMVNADEIASLCYERFNQLPRRGKPEPGREWTLLAAVLKITRRANTETGWTELLLAACNYCCNVFVFFLSKLYPFKFHISSTVYNGLLADVNI